MHSYYPRVELNILEGNTSGLKFLPTVTMNKDGIVKKYMHKTFQARIQDFLIGGG